MHHLFEANSSLCFRRLALGLALLALCTSCLFSPANEQQLCGANQPVVFSGYVARPGQTIRLQARTSASSVWTNLGATMSSTAPTNFFLGGTAYGFSATRSVALNESNGTALHILVRALQGSAPLTTFDVVTPTGQSGPGCLSTRLLQGDSFPVALTHCRSDESPIAEVTAPFASTCGCTHTTVKGNLIIDSAAKAADYVCLQTVDGALTITAQAAEVVSFPELTSVGGNIDFNYIYNFASGSYRARTIDVPLLATIGGDAKLQARCHPQACSAMVPAGLDAVQSVGGNIRMLLGNAQPQVFNQLSTHTGSLSVEGYPGGIIGNLDVDGQSSFQALTHVSGDVNVGGFYAMIRMLDALETLDGNLTVSSVRLSPLRSFSSLQTVAGDVEFHAIKQFGPTWPSLLSVDGELRVKNDSTLGSLSELPIGNVSVGALRLENNPSLNTLDALFQVELGDVNISGNPSLTACDVKNFLVDQLAGGWSGDAIVQPNPALCP